MYKNIILNYEYDVRSMSGFTNEIEYQIPYSYLGYTQYKIDNIKVEFDGVATAIVSKMIKLDEKDEEKKKMKEYTDIKLIDPLNYNLHVSEKYFEEKTNYPDPIEVCYIVGNRKNNAELVLIDHKKIYFNLICCSFLKQSLKNEFIMESDWQDYTEKLYFAFHDQDFRRISLKTVYINIKLRYDQ